MEGTVFLRKGAYAEPTLKAIHRKVQEINDHILPPGVKMVSFLDRSDLIRYTTHTVMRNLTEGFILVAVVLFLFLGNARSALIVALTIPFSLLFASICLDLDKHPRQSAVPRRPGFRHGGGRSRGHGGEHRPPHEPSRGRGQIAVADRIRAAAHEVQRPVFYAITIIITAYLPIFTLQKVEGGSSVPWRGPWPSRFSARWRSPCSSRPCWRASCSAGRFAIGKIPCFAS